MLDGLQRLRIASDRLERAQLDAGTVRITYLPTQQNNNFEDGTHVRCAEHVRG